MCGTEIVNGFPFELEISVAETQCRWTLVSSYSGRVGFVMTVD